MSCGYSIKFNKYGLSGRILTQRIGRRLPFKTGQADTIINQFPYRRLSSSIFSYHLLLLLITAVAVAGIYFSKPPCLLDEADRKSMLRVTQSIDQST
jgi:hypothetical protein